MGNYLGLKIEGDEEDLGEYSGEEEEEDESLEDDWFWYIPMLIIIIIFIFPEKWVWRIFFLIFI